MKIKNYLIYLCLIVTCTLSAQSNEDLAKSYFLRAQEAYSNGGAKSAIINLDQCVKSLGETNPKIEAFYIKIKTSNYELINHYALEVQQHYDNYMSMASAEHSDYNEVLKKAASIKSYAERYVKDYTEAMAANIDRNWEENGPIYINNLGYFNKEGTLAFDYDFIDGEQFRDGYAVVEIKRKEGGDFKNLIDTTGKRFSFYVYEDIVRKGKHLYHAEARSKSNIDFEDLINTKTGKRLNGYGSSARFIEEFQNNGTSIYTIYKKVRGEEESFEGIVTTDAEVLVRPEYEKIYPFRNGYARAYKEERVDGEYKTVYHFIKPDGEVVKMKAGWEFGDISEDGTFRYRNASNYDSKWGYQKGSQITISGQYDFAWDFSEGLAIVRKDKKCFVIDASGKVQGEITKDFRFEDGYGLFQNGKAILKSNEGFFLIAATGKAITETLRLTNLKFVSEDRVLANHNYGIPILMDLEFNKLTDDSLRRVYEFNEGVAKFAVGNEKSYISKYLYGLINLNGSIVEPPIHYDIDPFENGKAVVYDMYFNKTVINPLIKKYNGDDLISEGLIVVSQNGKYGFIDENENFKIDLLYDDAWNFNNGRAQVEVDGKIGFIDTSGRLVVPTKFDAFTFEESHQAYIGVIDGKKGLYTNDGSEIVSPIYDEIDSKDKNGFTKIKSNGLVGLLTGNYSVLVSPKYDLISDFYQDSNEFMLIKKNNLFGLLNRAGTEVFAPQFSGINSFNSKYNLALVADANGNHGYIDKFGQIAIPLMYKTASNFYDNGLAVVKEDGLLGCIETNGKTVVKPRYKSIEIFEDTPFIKVTTLDRKENTLTSYINKEGEEICDTEDYEHVKFSENKSFLIAYKGKRIYKIDITGDRTKI